MKLIDDIFNIEKISQNHLIQKITYPKHFSGQHVSVECEGTWWNAKVEDIDGSLVKVVFSVNGRREAIYRGNVNFS